MTITICVVAYNEERTLPRLLEDIKKQDYPRELIEVLLIDSMSTDRTKAIMKEFALKEKEFYGVSVLDNPKCRLAPGWNIAIQSAKTEAIVRIDAHARIPNDFIRKNVECLNSGEFVSGGPRPNVPENDSPWQEVLLLAESSTFGSGIAGFRASEKRQYVSSMFHAAYKKEVFEKVGLLDERLGRTEDNEINYRIRSYGYKLRYDPEIHSYQYTRSSLLKMIKQKYGNGYWVALTLKVCPQCLSAYHFVPFAFVAAILGTSALAVKGKTIFAKLLWGLYGSVAVLMSAASVRKKKKHIFQLALPVLFLILHISYGIGSLAGLLKLPFWNTKGDV